MIAVGAILTKLTCAWQLYIKNTLLLLSQTDRQMDRQKGMVYTCHYFCIQHLIKMYVESYKYVLMPWYVKGNNLCIPHYCTKTDKLQSSVNIQSIKCWCVEHRSCTVKQHSISAVQDLRINKKIWRLAEIKQNMVSI
jgi:hypothetical protein